MKRTIIFFTGVYDTLDLFTGELKRAFEEMGCASFVYEADREANSKKRLLALLAESGKLQAECDLPVSRSTIWGTIWNLLRQFPAVTLAGERMTLVNGSGKT